MSELVKMIVQGTEFAEHEAKTFLQLLVDHVRGGDQDQAAPAPALAQDLDEVRDTVTKDLADLRERVEALPVPTELNEAISTALAELTTRLDAFEKATTDRIDAIEKARAARAAAPAARPAA